MADFDASTYGERIANRGRLTHRPRRRGEPPSGIKKTIPQPPCGYTLRRPRRPLFVNGHGIARLQGDKKMKKKSARDISEKAAIDISEMMTVHEVSEYLHCHPSTIYRLLTTGRLPAWHLGRVWRFRRSDIDQLISRQSINDWVWLISSKANRQRRLGDSHGG